MNKRRRIIKEVEPDEIFLDAKNLPNFNAQQFEGRIEKPIPKRAINFLGIFFGLIGIVFIYQISFLQIIKGEAYFKKSENNTLDKQPIFADRGLIYDRNNILLAWNSSKDKTDINRLEAPARTYLNQGGFSHLLGYVSPPAKDSSGNYWQDNFLGKDGIEEVYDTELRGQNGVKITETDVKGVIQSENIVTPPQAGENIILSIDSRIQKKLYDSIASMANNSSFIGGTGIIMDIKTGELLALTSYPEYNSTILSAGQDEKTINGYLTDKRKVFLNRATSGLYSPGSTVKPFLAYGALAENIISPLKTIFSNGSISIPNPYFPGKKSIFLDHGTFGYVDMRKAIAVSSDVYFYEIGGGYQDQKGLGIMNIGKYINFFGITQKTGFDLGGELSGVIPSPEWKAKTFKGDIWRLGDTYNTAIGQYGFQVTPIQMVRAVGAIANEGTLLIPHVRLGDKEAEAKNIPITLDSEKIKIIKEGMRQAVTAGTCMIILNMRLLS